MSTLKVNKIENVATTAGGISIDNTGHAMIDGVQMPTAGAFSNRNLIINGAMQLAQRGTTSTDNGYKTVDRWSSTISTANGTQTQSPITSGDPYDEGFRHSYRITLTSTSTDVSGYTQLSTTLEAQDIANSGWKYKDPNHSLTCSFWAKSSVAGTYNAQYRAKDNGNFFYNRAFTLVAGVWKKITHTIPGHASLVFNNDNGEGLMMVVVPYYGTQHTDSSVSNDSWFSLSGGHYFPDYAQNFLSSAGATFDITGVQLEVGEMATPFEHRSYADELLKCQRYFYAALNHDETDEGFIMGHMWGTGGNAASTYGEVMFPVTMRREPDLIANVVGGGIRNYCENTAAFLSASHGSISAQLAGKSRFIIGVHNWNTGGGGTGGSTKFWTPGFGSWLEKYDATQRIDFNAEF